MTTLKFFAKTHNKKTKELISLLRENIDTLNSDDEHAKFVDNEWQLDDYAVQFFDKLLEEKNITSDFSFPEPEFLTSGKKNISPEEVEISVLREKVSSLTQSLQKAELQAKEKEDEFINLQSRILSYENGATSINGDLIRKYQSKSERLEKELEQTKSDMLKLRDMKDDRISKQENTIRELQNKISELNGIIKKKMDSDMENLQKSISEDKLKSEIHNLELKLADSERNKEQVRIALEDSQNKNFELCKLIEASTKSLQKIQIQLNNGIGVQAVDISNNEDQNKVTFAQTEIVNENVLPETPVEPKRNFFVRALKAAGFF